MELSRIIPLVGLGIAFAGGLAYLTAAFIVGAGRSIDAALRDFFGEEDGDE